MKKKRKIWMFLFLGLLLSMTTVSVSAESASKKAMKAYAKFLKKGDFTSSSEIVGSKIDSFCVIDIDRDGIKELIVMTKYKYFDVLCYQNGKVRPVKECRGKVWNEDRKGNYLEYNKSQKALSVLTHGGTGLKGYQLYKKSKNKMYTKLEISSYSVWKDGRIVRRTCSVRDKSNSRGISYKTFKKYYNQYFSSKKVQKVYFVKNTAGNRKKKLGVSGSNPPAPVQVRITGGQSGNSSTVFSVSGAPAGSTVTWTTSNSYVAVVSNGNVTARGNGTAVITANVKVPNGRIYSCSRSITVDTAKSYGNWSDWSIDAISQTGTREVRTTTLYRYYYFYCPVCGGREPYQGRSDCHQYNLSLQDGHVGWFTTPYSQCSSTAYSYYGGAKRYTRSLGDGQLWNLNTSNLYDTAIGTRDDGSGAIIIAKGYSYREVYSRYRIWI